ncbi:MAG: type II secretion system protein [Parcubacteria group bacterium]|nr:type II secretion system protein [Parcubacteria group bacterium]
MNISNERGFTLLEMIVTITIIGILSTIVVINYRGASRDLDLSVEALASAIRKAQAFAITGEPYLGAVPEGGYGFFIGACGAPPCEYRLFADVNGNLHYDGAQEAMDTEVFFTPKNVRIVSADPFIPLHVTFKPPKPFICFKSSASGECASEDVAVIHIRDEKSGKNKEVRIHRLTGQISVE